MEHIFKVGEIVRLKKHSPVPLNKWDQKRFKDLQGIKFRVVCTIEAPFNVFLKLVNLSDGKRININCIMMEKVSEYQLPCLF